MNRFKDKTYFIILVGTIFLISCKKENNNHRGTSPKWYNEVNLPINPYDYKYQTLPSFYNDQFIAIADNTPSDNSITNWGATLGRVLFYDKRLSKNNTISCASCHVQEKSFTDPNRFSVGSVKLFSCT